MVVFWSICIGVLTGSIYQNYKKMVDDIDYSDGIIGNVITGIIGAVSGHIYIGEWGVTFQGFSVTSAILVSILFVFTWNLLVKMYKIGEAQ